MFLLRIFWANLFHVFMLICAEKSLKSIYVQCLTSFTDSIWCYFWCIISIIDHIILSFQFPKEYINSCAISLPVLNVDTFIYHIVFVVITSGLSHTNHVWLVSHQPCITLCFTLCFTPLCFTPTMFHTNYVSLASYQPYFTCIIPTIFYLHHTNHVSLVIT